MDTFVAATDSRDYLAVPVTAAPWPGVVVIHDVLGMTNDLRRQADWLAREGFIALAPDLGYSASRHPVCVRNAIRQLRDQKGAVFDQLSAAGRSLVARPDCSGRIGAIGFCLGGGFALALAGRHQVEVASVNYGDVPLEATSDLAHACPIVASYGARDRRLATHPERLRDALMANNVEHDLVVYPTAGHAFMNYHGRVVNALGKRVNMCHDAAADADARRRILTFFRSHLQSTSA